MHKITKEDIDGLIIKLQAFNKDTHEDEIEQLTDLASFIMDLGGGVSESIKRLLGNYQEVDTNLLDYLIKNVDPEKMKIIYSSGILRYTAYYKEKLPSYNNLLNNVEKECIKKQENVEDILVGLKD